MTCGSRMLISSLRKLQLSDNDSVIGGETEMVQAQFSETFLKGEDVISTGITKLKILDEGSYIKGNYGEQLQVRVLANDKDKKKYKWSLGAKANDQLIILFGKDTAEWVGKEIEITTEIDAHQDLGSLIGEIADLPLNFNKGSFPSPRFGLRTFHCLW